jgi:SAM-dependent methyltransferase
MNACNICDGRIFGPGPSGRLSIDGHPPRCVGCGSLERHRVARRIIDAIRLPDLFARYRLIRFSPDPIIVDEWFASAELSVYGGENSCNLEAIDRPDEAYDIILCSHVLEHVRDDARALRELVRVVSHAGFILLIVPRTETGSVTDDWGFADPEKNFHYRGYGRDFDARITGIVPNAYVLAAEALDPVTGDGKRMHMLTKSAFWRDRWLAATVLLASGNSSTTQSLVT